MAGCIGHPLSIFKLAALQLLPPAGRPFSTGLPREESKATLAAMLAPEVRHAAERALTAIRQRRMRALGIA